VHAILITAGSGGDIYPFLQLGRELKQRGHQCTLITHCVYEEKASRYGLDFTPLDTPAEYQAFIEDQPLLNTPRGIPQFLRRHALSSVSVLFELVSRHVSRQDTVLLTRDLFDTAPRLISEKLGLPLIWVFISPSQITTAPLRARLFSSMLASDIERIRSSLGLQPSVPETYWLTYASESIALWPEWFAASEDWPSKLVSVGFMVEDATETDGLLHSRIESMLAKGPPPVLITAGTGAYLGGDFHDASARACTLLNRPGIVVSRYAAQIPRHLPDSVCSVDFLPFRTLMPRMGAVIHHGGVGTLSCALGAGVPQLVLPMGADRPDNAVRLQRLGVAEYLPPPQWKPELIADSLRRLLDSPAVSHRCNEFAKRLENANAAKAACEVIERQLPQRNQTPMQ
jgi:rhamnosyltransferase subunit B